MAPQHRSPLMQLFSVMAESLLVGVFSVLILLILWIFVTRHRTLPVMHKILFGACFIMYLIAGSHLSLLLEEASHGPVFPTPAVGKAVIVLASFQFAISDLILIWRVWVIWSRNWLIVVVPLILLIVASGFALALADPAKIVNFYEPTPVILTVLNTSLCTILIVGKIWYMRRRIEKVTERTMISCSKYNGVVALIIESGVLYTTSSILTLILNQIRSPGLSVMLNLHVPLIGILPTLITVFVHFDMVPGTATAKTYANKFGDPSTTPVALDTIISTAAVVTGDHIVFGNDIERGAKL